MQTVQFIISCEFVFAILAAFALASNKVKDIPSNDMIVQRIQKVHSHSKHEILSNVWCRGTHSSRDLPQVWSATTPISVTGNVSYAWYLVPLFFGILGGVIAWAVNKGRNPEKALKFFVFGIISTVFFLNRWLDVLGCFTDDALS